MKQDSKRNGNSEYKDVRWQKLRLRALELHEWTCQLCDTKDNRDLLHVHHTYYDKGKPVWDYPVYAMIVLCETCHEKVTDLKRELGRHVHKRAAFHALRMIVHLLSLPGGDDEVGALGSVAFEMATSLQAVSNQMDKIMELEAENRELKAKLEDKEQEEEDRAVPASNRPF